MMRVTRKVLLAAVIFIPIMIIVVVPENLSVNVRDLAGFSIIMISYVWYFSLLNIINRYGLVDYAQRSFVIGILLIIPVLNLLDILGFEVRSAVAHSTILTVALITAIILSFIAFFILSDKFCRLLKMKGFETGIGIVFLCLVLFPVGMWKYHEQLRAWSRVNNSVE